MVPGRDDQLYLPLTAEDLMLLRAGLRQYLLYWQRHVQEDGGATHSQDEHAEIRRRVGELIWRLETASAPPNSRIRHSEEAVQPSNVDPPTDNDPAR